VRLAVGDVLLLFPARLLGFWIRHLVSPRLLRRLPTHAHGLLGALAGPGVRVRPLPSNREAPAVAGALIGTDLDLPLDVLGHVPAEVTFHLVVAVDPLSDPDDLFLGEVADLPAAVDVQPSHGGQGPGRPDPVNVAKSDIHPLVAGEVDACDPRHASVPLTLSLLVGWVLRADDHDPAVPPDDLALVAHLLHRWPNLHRSKLTLSPLSRYRSLILP